MAVLCVHCKELFGVYRVTAEVDDEGKIIRTLGYATGNRADIGSVYEAEKYRSFEITEVDVRTVTPELAVHTNELRIRKAVLEDELAATKRQLGE